MTIEELDKQIEMLKKQLEIEKLRAKILSLREENNKKEAALNNTTASTDNTVTAEELKEVLYKKDVEYVDDDTVDENVTKDMKNHIYYSNNADDLLQMVEDGTIIVTQQAIDNLKADKKRRAIELRNNTNAEKYKEYIDYNKKLDEADEEEMKKPDKKLSNEEIDSLLKLM